MSKKKIDLSPELKKPLDSANLANDEGTLRILAGELNKGARVAKDTPVVVDTTRYSGPTGEGNTTLLTDSMPTAQEQAAQAAAMRPTALQAAVAEAQSKASIEDLMKGPPTKFPLTERNTPPVPPLTQKSRKLVFTGRNLTALVDQLDATHFSLTDGATALAELLTEGITTGTPGYGDLLNTLIAWGNSEYSDQFPLSPERLLFCNMVRALPGYQEFGNGKAYWTDALVTEAHSMDFDDLVVFTGIVDIAALNYFKAQGFQHWHVTGPANAKVDPLSHQCDQDVIRTLSKDRNGPKLRVIWSPETPCPSPRLWTVQEFLK